ncbi:hypothetical protein SDC9_105136 [bioreactor metagenome]|uniref:Uncharacterized protein n=1 Tax=bioreactor metagenome TaxID=1076179 RepID=A0A645AYI6_9ZZZZ
MIVVVDPGLDGVVDFIGGLDARTLGHAEDTHQLIGQPVPHRGAVEIAPVCTEGAPRRPVVGLGHIGAGHRNAQLGQFDAVGVQDAVDVVVRSQQQPRGVAE